MVIMELTRDIELAEETVCRTRTINDLFHVMTASGDLASGRIQLQGVCRTPHARTQSAKRVKG